MKNTVLAITPPFTQLNTPYPATAYIKGFLNTKNISCTQLDLGIEVILSLFSKNGLEELFKTIEQKKETFSLNSKRIIALKDNYTSSIDAVILFLQGRNPTLSHLICQEDYLPEASRFDSLEEDLDWAFGSMGMQDKAKHLATLYLEDLSDLIQECIDNNFGFSRYAERLGRSAKSFDELYFALNQDFTYIDSILIQHLESKFEQFKIENSLPKLVVITVPFPGNLYAAFRIGQWVKKHFPTIKIAMGGGFANTELRSVSDVRVFDFFDFICLDDGETPIECLIDLVLDKNTNLELKRTFCLQDGIVKYINNSKKGDYKQSEIGTPDYSDLLLEKYISVIEIVNPMHRMWSDGRWNKLTMAHGCYWGKCTFCDISLDYIKLYEPIAAKILCDRIETLIAQTGQNGFHFVDEAAPPALMRALAIEIIKRKITVSWWTNIRFEKSFTKDLCLLLKASGCIAVSGGLEVASDRLLELIQKGVTVAQVAKVSQNFNEAGIMVHAYLMYGFPSQTAQETIDSLEMVRQMFEIGVLQSGFWHQFAMTEHSPVGMFPEQFNVTKNTNLLGSFANNDIVHQDATGTDHELFSFGLKKSLHNFMHGICFDLPLQDWFDFKIPRTKIPKNFIQNALSENDDFLIKPSSKIIWLGNMPEISFQNSKRGEIATLIFINKKDNFTLKIDKPNGEWIMTLIEKISIKNNKSFSFQEIKEDYESAGFEHFELLWYNKPFASLKEHGLLSF